MWPNEAFSLSYMIATSRLSFVRNLLWAIGVNCR